MKKIIFLLIIIIFTSALYAQQYGWIKILDSDSCGIVGFKHFWLNEQSPKDIYVLFGGPVSSEPQVRYRSWNRLDKASYLWYFLSHNSFLHSNPFFCPWPPIPSWVYYTVNDFAISPIDTNFILQIRDVPPCSPWILEPIQDTRITYNNGQTTITLTQFGNDFLGNLSSGFDIDPVNDSIMYFAYPVMQTMTRCIWKSTNRGVNWEITDTISSLTTPGILKVNPLKRTELYVTADYMYKSTTGGYNFFNLGVSKFNDMVFDPVDSSIYGSSDYQPLTPGIYKSTNQGNNWSIQKPGHFHCLEINPDNHNVLYTGSDSGLYRSVDGGQNWTLFNNSFYPSRRVIGISKDPSTGSLVHVVTSDAVYIVWGTYVGIKEVTNTVPDNFSLFQNYPNPFNPNTKIKFQIKKLQDVKLIVFDVLGRDITTLVNEELQPGTYEVKWDGTNYPSGVYFYKIITASYSDTKKMVLIK